MDSDVIDQLLIRYSSLVRYWAQNGGTMVQFHHLFVDFEKACDSLYKEVLYNTTTEFDVAMKLVTLFEICLNKIFSKVRMDENLIQFLFIMMWKKEMFYRHFFSTLLYNVPSGRYKKTRKDWK
jgi:hypothetical protein